MKKNNWMKKIVLAFVGILLIGVGVAFNAAAGLGNDPVGIFYDGIRAVLGLSGEQLGTASNIVNISLVALLLFIGRKYVNIGTIIYILPYGLCVSLGTKLYSVFFATGIEVQSLSIQIIASVIGCVLLYVGVAIFVTLDIGVDPMTGVAMVIRDKMHWEFRQAKWLFDGVMTGLGFLLGGKLGVITIVTAFTAGPAIQFVSGILSKMTKGDLNERKAFVSDVAGT